MQLNTAKLHLKKNRWTQEQAARHLNVTQSYLNRVLNGEMKSERLMKAVMSLGMNPNPKKAPAYQLAA